jgi:hypothetical protein
VDAKEIRLDTKVKKGWIIEYNGYSGDYFIKGQKSWLRSGNRVTTVPGIELSHSKYVFASREAARKEIKAQIDGFDYRVVREK